jgi:hypothetical protein
MKLRNMKRNLAWISFSLLLVRAEGAFGYCQATTCGALPDDECSVDTEGCAKDGAPLAWPLDASVTVVCRSGCDEVVTSALSAAVQSWQEARCNAGLPRIGLEWTEDPPTELEGDFVFVEVVTDGWPYGASTVGRTTLEFGITSGTLARATISLNAQDFVLGVETLSDEVNARAVLTHELGHALGLSHSSISGATMQPEAELGYISELSSLHDDDEQGLCALYPPAPIDAGPGGEGGGPSPIGDSGGCSVAHPRTPWSAGWSAALLLLLARFREQRTARSRNP